MGSIPHHLRCWLRLLNAFISIWFDLVFILYDYFRIDTSTETAQWSRCQSNWYPCASIYTLQRSERSYRCYWPRYHEYYTWSQWSEHANSSENGPTNGNDQFQLSFSSNNDGKISRTMNQTHWYLFIEYWHIWSRRLQIQFRQFDSVPFIQSFRHSSSNGNGIIFCFQNSIEQWSESTFVYGKWNVVIRSIRQRFYILFRPQLHCGLMPFSHLLMLTTNWLLLKLVLALNYWDRTFRVLMVEPGRWVLNFIQSFNR